LRDAHPDDAASICAIYNHYIQHSYATFEEVLLAPEDMRGRIEETTKTYPWFVWEESDTIAGYCYGRRWRERAAYRYSVESTIYLEPAAVGKGNRIGLVRSAIDRTPPPELSLRHRRRFAPQSGQRRAA